MIDRRQFIETVAAVAAVPLFGRQPAPANEWGSPVFDLHHHLRQAPAANFAHLDGAGITRANLLTRGAAQERVKELDAASPGRFIWFHSADITRPDAEAQLTQAVKDGARGFGELKFHVAADGPELRRANLFGDCAANSGNNALSRDPGFTPDFLLRHQDKLLFGSDCSCADGRGGGVSQSNNPAASRLAGKCVARETLTVLKKSASPEIFRKIVWTNAHTLLKM